MKNNKIKTLLTTIIILFLCINVKAAQHTSERTFDYYWNITSNGLTTLNKTVQDGIVEISIGDKQYFFFNFHESQQLTPKAKYNDLIITSDNDSITLDTKYLTIYKTNTRESTTNTGSNGGLAFVIINDFATLENPIEKTEFDNIKAIEYIAVLENSTYVIKKFDTNKANISLDKSSTNIDDYYTTIYTTTIAPNTQPMPTQNQLSVPFYVSIIAICLIPVIVIVYKKSYAI